MSIKKKAKNYNVLIEEGLRTRQMYPTDILKVDNTDSTDSLWMPQDNANYGTLYASENGIYIAARDGYDAYSEVDVRVTFDDFSDLDIDNLDSTWDLDSLDDLVIDEDLDIDEFDDLFNNEDLWDDPFDKIDSSFDDRVKGIDPVSGNKYAVGLDANGFLDDYLLPTKIKIVRFPNKTKYLNGETIDYTGIVVMAFSEDDKVWKNEKYPDGVIPFEELIFPVEIADAAEADNIKYVKTDLDIGDVEQPIPIATKKAQKTSRYDHTNAIVTKIMQLDNVRYYHRSGSNYAYGVFEACAFIRSTDDDGIDHYNAKIYATSKIPKEYEGLPVKGRLCSEVYVDYYYESPSRSYEEHEYGYPAEFNETDTVTHDEKTVYFTGRFEGGGEDELIPPRAISPKNFKALFPDDENDIYVRNIAWAIIYGDITGGVQSIPVQWRSIDGEILETSFFVSVSYPNETLPDHEWNIIDPTINPHDIPETPEGEVTP